MFGVTESRTFVTMLSITSMLLIAVMLWSRRALLPDTKSRKNFVAACALFCGGSGIFVGWLALH